MDSWVWLRFYEEKGLLLYQPSTPIMSFDCWANL
jgi:hypothetical protein